MRADVIATLVQDGGFRIVEDGLTMHIREKAPDGSFRDIFVNDDRDPNESLQYSAASGLLLEQAGGSFLVLQNGDLIREDRVSGENNVVAFETYALDLSQLGAPNAAAVLQGEGALDALPAGAAARRHVLRQAARSALPCEIHDRMTAPLYTLAFAFIALAFLGRPRTNRQDRSFAIAAVVLSLPRCCAPPASRAVAVARGVERRDPVPLRDPAGRHRASGSTRSHCGARLRMPRLRRSGVGRRRGCRRSERCGARRLRPAAEGGGR